MIEKIHHLAIAVNSIEDGLAIYEDALGLKCEHREDIPGQKVKTAMLPVGDTRIELVQPMDPSSPVAKHLEKNGPGMHHLAFKVKDIQASLDKLAEQGMPLVHKEGQAGVGGSLIAFLHPKGTGGLLIELVQEKE